MKIKAIIYHRLTVYRVKTPVFTVWHYVRKIKLFVHDFCEYLLPTF